MEMIRLDHVTKSYGAQTVLNDFSLSVEAGEILTVIGRSGCGKTTMLKTINGLCRPDQGISRDDVVALEDDKGYQVNYYCSTVVREDALEKYPKLEETLLLMDGILSDQEMAELNYQVEVDGKDEADVAREFLIEKGLIEE